MDQINFAKEIESVYQRIKNSIRQTPLIKSYHLSKQFNANIYFKLETLQYTNSFKVRGALNKLLSLSDKYREKGIIAASSGNHGAAVAYVAELLNIPAHIYLPKTATQAKIENIQQYGARIIFHGDDCNQAEQFAKQVAMETNVDYISPYNDIDIVLGQGTVTYEIMQQLPELDQIYVPIGGGGLISGVASYVKSVKPQATVIGCLPENSPVMAESIKAGKIIDMQNLPTLSDATAGNIDHDSITFELCQQFVDQYLQTSEQQIITAMQFLNDKEKLWVEGVCGMVLACLYKQAEPIQSKNIVLVLSGGNVSIQAQ